MFLELREQNLGSVFFWLDDTGLNKGAEMYKSKHLYALEKLMLALTWKLKHHLCV